MKKILDFKTYHPAGGVVEEDIILQYIKIYAPNDENEKVINVIGNAYVDRSSKKYYSMLISLHLSATSLTYYMVLVIRMILTI